MKYSHLKALMVIVTIMNTIVLNAQDYTLFGGSYSFVDTNGERITIDTLAISLPFSYVQQLFSQSLLPANKTDTGAPMVNSRMPRLYWWLVIIVSVIFAALLIGQVIVPGIKRLIKIINRLNKDKKKKSHDNDSGLFLLFVLDLCLIGLILWPLLDFGRHEIKLTENQLAFLPPLIMALLSYIVAYFVYFFNDKNSNHINRWDQSPKNDSNSEKNSPESSSHLGTN